MLSIYTTKWLQATSLVSFLLLLFVCMFFDFLDIYIYTYISPLIPESSNLHALIPRVSYRNDAEALVISEIHTRCPLAFAPGAPAAGRSKTSSFWEYLLLCKQLGLKILQNIHKHEATKLKPSLFIHCLLWVSVTFTLILHPLLGYVNTSCSVSF